MKHSITFDTLELVQKRLEFLVGARWEDKKEIIKAADEQDIIREKLSKRLNGNDSTTITRKLRNSRCMC